MDGGNGTQGGHLGVEDASPYSDQVGRVDHSGTRLHDEVPLGQVGALAPGDFPLGEHLGGGGGVGAADHVYVARLHGHVGGEVPREEELAVLRPVGEGVVEIEAGLQVPGVRGSRGGVKVKEEYLGSWWLPLPPQTRNWSEPGRWKARWPHRGVGRSGKLTVEEPNTWDGMVWIPIVG